MGRPPSNGVPAFRFNTNEVAEMEAILQEHNNALPSRELMIALAEKFSEAPERKGKITVQMKQVWNWFQNKRYALRAKFSRGIPEDPNVMPPTRVDSGPTRIMHQPATGSLPIPKTAPVQVPAPISTPAQAPAPIPAPSVQPSGNAASENPPMEFEAKSARDGAWYDVQCFLAHKNFETNNPEVQVRIVGFGPEEDEWVNVRKNVRPRSLPCEASECVAVLPGDLILCFQEGKDQALYYDAHVLDAQRRRHDVRGCRCRFLVRYEHDQAEEIVPLRKVCRRPQTDFRLQQLHAMAKMSAASVNQPKTNVATSVSATPRPNNPTPTTTKPVAVPHTNVATAATTTTTATSTPNIVRINMPKPPNSGIPVVPPAVSRANNAIPTVSSTPGIVRANPSSAPMMPSKPTISRITVVGPAVPQSIAAETGREIITANASATSGPTDNVGQGGSVGNSQG